MSVGLTDEYLRLMHKWSIEDRVSKRNALTRKMVEQIRELSGSEEGRAALIALIDHPNEDVRLDAAVASIDWAPDRAIPVLEEIEKGSGIRSFSAEQVLMGHRTGRRHKWVPVMLGNRQLPITQEGYERAVRAHERVSTTSLADAWAQEPDSFTAAAATFRVLRRVDVALVFAEARQVLMRGDRRTLTQREADRLNELERQYELLPDPRALLDRVTPFRA
ncbi:DUF2019 domain-containing protein [uncultured Microbacterium sp.]|uniref:DUF2019 domain-containing protein n=1 Tax=uncultured Microbacterium sp. TaxID=191216 RepID=UPI0025DA2EB2|nr:DUF2019 domain-containing protein [uncultured Microbacterium sp.]